MAAPLDKKLVGMSFIAILGVLAAAAALVQVQSLNGQISGLNGQVATLEGQLKDLTKPPAQKTQSFDIIIGEAKYITEEGGQDVLGAEGHRFEPMVIVVHKGDKVSITVKNVRKNIHSFVLPAFGVDSGSIAPRTGTAKVEFNANKAGAFQFYCGISFDPSGKCDIDHAFMVGWLIVLE